MKKTYKLTKDFGANLNTLVINASKIDERYIDLLPAIFQECIFLEENYLSQTDRYKNTDIIFIGIDDAFTIDEQKEIKQLLKILGKQNEFLQVYIIEDKLTNLKISQIAHQSYFVQGTTPTPYNEKKLYKFLYRILKYITNVKNLHDYVAVLENQLMNINLVEEKPKKKKEKTKETTLTTKKDIRHSYNEKISAQEFLSTLDDVIIDKVELFQEELDLLITLVYDLETSNTTNDSQILQQINEKLDAVYRLVDSVIVFPIIARSFASLYQLIEELPNDAYSKEETKSMFAQMLLAVVTDLEKWIKVIFITHETHDIHYFDASFASNILEIENFLKTQKSEEETDDDEDDLEFF